MLLELKFYSDELKKCTQAVVIIPRAREAAEDDHKILWLFHGLSDDQSIWTRRTSIERYAEEHQLVIVMPNVDRSWYANTAYGVNYFNYVTEELPRVCQRTIKGFNAKRENNIVGGLSMGGYGAIKIALSYPERYFACISLSGALDITRKEGYYSLCEWQSIFGFDIKSADELAGTKHDVFHLAKELHKSGKPFPKLYMWCGTEDSLLEPNRKFHDLLSSLGVKHKYEESEGDHSWIWWDKHIQPGMKYVQTEDPV